MILTLTELRSTLKDLGITERFNGGGDFLWECYGPDCTCRDLTIRNPAGAISIITQDCGRIIEATGYLDDIKKYPWMPWRWIDQEFKQEYFDECAKRNIDTHIAWDSVRYSDIDSPQQVLNVLQFMRP